MSSRFYATLQQAESTSRTHTATKVCLLDLHRNLQQRKVICPNLQEDIENSRDARTPQPGEIFFNTMRYRSSVTVQSSRYFQSSISYIKVQIMLK